MTLILASASPQRRAILTQLGLTFEVVVADVPELEQGDPVEVVCENARRKARAVAHRRGHAPDELVIGVDTEVHLDGEIFGKPADAADARAMLGRLNGRTHEVHSGLALVRGEDEQVHHDVTRVTFRTLTDDQIADYVDLGEWEGRAGGFAIQLRGAALIRRIEGDYLNVVGFPVAACLDAAPELMRASR
ncbi:MAG: septum formation protein Maf [Solirubrobacteraceae bacterium]|nr:septum formation protein Maf [Solirubrobacteraceae bacterium]